MNPAKGKPAPIICHHCGRDYAREYWNSWGSLENPKPLVRADPCVCFSCRRDTNRDAADAPRWVAGAHAVEAETSPVTVVTQSRKRCRTCGGEWEGLIFGPCPSVDSPLPFGICPACGAKEDAAIAAANARVVPVGMPLPEMARPRRVTNE